MGFLILGYLLAAPQLVPSWDLLRSSQRTKTNEEFLSTLKTDVI